MTETLLNEMELDALAEMGNIAMGSGATALSQLVSKKIVITAPEVVVRTMDELYDHYADGYVLAASQYTEGLQGSNMMLVKEKDAALIAALMMGMDDTDSLPELDEMTLRAIAEAMNQIMGSGATALAKLLDLKINIAPAAVHVMLADQPPEATTRFASGQMLVQTSFRLTIEGLLDSNIIQIIPVEFARGLVSRMLAIEGAAPGIPPGQPSQNPPGGKHSGKTRLQVLKQFFGTMPVKVSIVLGEGTVSLGEFTGLSRDSILRLDQRPGQPAMVLANGMPVAEGEVVTVDGKYAVKISRIIEPQPCRPNHDEEDSYID